MPPHILGGLIRSQSLVCTLAHQPVGGPRQKAHFADQLGPNPGNTREIERRSEAAGSRRRHVERHLGGTKWLKGSVQALQLGVGHARAHAPGVAMPATFRR
jgi:hypothetical protein